MTWRVLTADCVRAMRWMAPNSVDAVVCDPPYGLSVEPDPFELLRHWLAGDDYTHRGGGFMGKTWDSFVPGPVVWRECFRVLKPGGHLLAFAGTRTEDLMGLAIRLAGFERRDTLAWFYGSGFPKSHDVSKAIDKTAGFERDVIGQRQGANTGAGLLEQRASSFTPGLIDVTAPATPDAERWQGWGTALKPAHEPIIVARKPLLGTVAANVLEHGTGALNIDGTRIGTSKDVPASAAPPQAGNVVGYGATVALSERSGMNPDVGRWPANVLLDAEAASMLDAQTGTLKSGTRKAGEYGGIGAGAIYGDGGVTPLPAIEGNEGGASRFFYCAKASKRERNAGLDAFEKSAASVGNKEAAGRDGSKPGNALPGGARDRVERGLPPTEPRANVHPTVKPVDVMRWLCRLVTPPGGIVLDPFVGSGTTGIAAVLEGFRFVGIDQDASYAAIARARIELFAERGEDALEQVRALEAADAKRAAITDTGQLDLLGGVA